MNDETAATRMGRRELLKWAGGAAALAGAGGALARWKGPMLNPFAVETAAAGAVQAPAPDAAIFMGGTDGWISLPQGFVTGQTNPLAPYHPDPLAPAPYTDYIFGFRNLTNLTDTQRSLQKNHAQATAPLFWVRGVDPLAANPVDFKVSITNLGLAQRPDLFDAHTLHWHGFRNVIPFFDGEPTGSVAVPAGSVFTYVYRPRDPGTYMYHCHVEDVEHVHMGMTGMVFVRPFQNDKWAYNDAGTAFDREFSMMLTEVWAEAHWADAHIQLPEWSDYRPDFSLLNGRVYPDTLVSGAPLDPSIEPNASAAGLNYLPYVPAQIDANGDLVAPAGRPDLKRQPLSSLVTCNEGDKVLLRFANLGFKEAAMTLSGMKCRVVGRDATPMRGRDGTETSYETNTISMGAGESCDAIFTAPAHSGGSGRDVYVLSNRNLTRRNGAGPGGQTTEIRVYPAGTIGTQPYPNY